MKSIMHAFRGKKVNKQQKIDNNEKLRNINLSTRIILYTLEYSLNLILINCLDSDSCIRRNKQFP